jgi:hypothetical protein
MKSSHKALLAAIAVVALLTGWPLWMNASFYFVNPALQIMDFASNDMLVVEAKKLSLLHGHYSRAGFYHPGPFYLYWLAGWEALLHDHFALFTSPASVQHFAATLLMALAFGAFTVLTTKLSRNMLTGFAATAVLFVLVYFCDGNVITAPWTPHMLVASSIFTVTACAGLLLQGWGWLPLLCLGALQLLHGHASFVGLLPVLTLPTLLLACRRHGWPGMRSPALWLAASITGVMLAPLAAISLFNFPEPWLSYLRQAGNGQHLDLKSAAVLLGGFLPPVLAGIPLALAPALMPLVLAPTLRTRNAAAIDAVATARTAVVICASGLVAGAWFALRGVDSIDNNYLLFWLAPFVALPGALAVVVLADRLTRIGATLLCVIIVAATAMTCRHMLPWLMFNAAHHAQYQQLWQRLQQLAPENGLVHLHVDRRAAYADIWSQVATLLSLSTRLDRPVLCVAASSWDLSYHAKTRCSDQGDASSVHVIATAEPAADTAEDISEIKGIFYRRTVPAY